jgi:hypothetical protein
MVHNDSSGGTKYIHHMCNLMRERGLDATLVVPDGSPLYANWLIEPAPTITRSAMVARCTPEDIVIDFWNDVGTISTTQKLPARVKIFCCGNSSFLTGPGLLGDDFLTRDMGYTHFWTAGESAKRQLEQKYQKSFHIVHHYFAFDNYRRAIAGIKRQRRILGITRKGARYLHATRIANILRMLGERTNFRVINRRFVEPEFFTWASSCRFFLHTPVGLAPSWKNRRAGMGIIYPDGKSTEVFPLPPAEAALAGAVVIGFAKDGDWEWMDHNNTFISKDKSYIELLKAVRRALTTPAEELDAMNARARAALARFNKDQTWREIDTFLQTL